MTSSEEHTFENNWRKAFDNADEVPPLSVWERIEARLDEDEDRVVIIPLWLQWQTLKWVTAAGVTILLVALGGWWSAKNSKSNIQLTNKENIEKVASKPNMGNKTSDEILESGKAMPKMQTLPSENPKETLAIITTPKEPNIETHSISTKDESRFKNNLSKTYQQKNSLPTLSEEELVVSSLKNKTALLQKNLPTAVLKETTISSIPNNTLPAIFDPIILSTPILALSSLNSKEMRELTGLSKRQPWVAYQTTQSEQKVQEITTKEYWASIGMMPASYNAGVSIGGSQSGNAFNSNNQSFSPNTTQSSSSTNRPSFSYAFQWQGGVQLAQRWSLETGLNYLQGNSVFEGTNGFNVFSNSYINNLEAAINISDNSKQRYDFAAIGTDKSQVQSLTTSQNISNSYQFLQIPMQAGYAVIKPKRKMSLWLLAGFINNIFLRNSFQSGQESTVIVSGADNPYRTLSFSASTGVRIQYKMNKRWTTLLSGNFQQALGSATRSGAAFEARPQLLGVGAGLRYGF